MVQGISGFMMTLSPSNHLPSNVRYDARHHTNHGSEGFSHYPVSSFSCRLSQFDHYERLQVSGLVEERVLLIQGMTEYVGRDAPSVAMLPMCLDTSLVDTP